MPDLPILITTTGELAHLVSLLRAEPLIAVDTESNSLYAYFEQVCLIQFSTPTADYVVDTIALHDVAPLAGIFGDRSQVKIFHAAEYDILCLKRDYHFEFAALYDTMTVARILGWKAVGLAAILTDKFGVTLDKRFQRANWGARPLSAEQLSYARKDTHYLLRLRELQLAELERLGRRQEAEEEFEKLARLEPAPRQFDPDRYATLDGARDLDAIGLGILREVHRFREARAQAEDRPPFKVVTNSALVELARVRPTTESALARVPGLGEWALRKYGKGLLQAVERGRGAPQHKYPRRVHRPLDGSARDRLGRLKEWRRQRALTRGVEPDVIVSNDVLTSLAVQNPRTLEELVGAAQLGRWKASQYGQELLAVLAGRKGI